MDQRDVESLKGRLRNPMRFHISNLGYRGSEEEEEGELNTSSHNGSTY